MAFLPNPGPLGPLGSCRSFCSCRHLYLRLQLSNHPQPSPTTLDAKQMPRDPWRLELNIVTFKFVLSCTSRFLGEDFPPVPKNQGLGSQAHRPQLRVHRS